MNLARFVLGILFLFILTEATPQNIKLTVDKGLLAGSYADRSDKEYPFTENIPLFSFRVNDSIYSISDATIHGYDEGYSFSFHDNITGEIIRDTDETRGWACRIIIRNHRLDKVYVENVVPFGESGGHIYLTSTGPWALARAKLFRPGRGPVGVILPDNAWEMGYGSVVLDDDISACAIARRVRSEKAEWRRYRTILFPEGWVEYVFYADDYAGEWQNGLRLMFRDRWLYDLEDFDETLYHRDDLKWIRNKYLIGLQFAWNQEYYDWKTQQYHLEDFLQKGRELFGGYDVFGLWPTWPRLGVDQRNQWDLFTDLPGGLETLRPDGVKLFICYNPWDESTRAEDPYDGLAKLIEATDADGVVLDCHGASSFELQRAADSIKPGVVMYSEGMAVVKDMPGIVSGRVHDAIHLPPPLNLNKLIRPDFAIFRVCQIRDGRIKREASIAFFNGYGTELNTFAPGRFENMEEDLRYLGRTTRILRENTSNFLVNDWTPLLPALRDSIWVNKWPLGEKTIFTVFSLVPEGYRGPLFEESAKEGYRLVSLWHHEELEWEEISGKSYIPVKAEAFNRFDLNTRAEGNIDCIALLPKRITAEIQGGVLHLAVNEGDQLIAWAGNPSYQNERKLHLAPGRHQVDLMADIFGKHEGKYVIQLFTGIELTDEAVVYLHPGTPRLIGQQEKTHLMKKAPDDMVFIPGGTFSFRAENTDQFIPYPQSKEPAKMNMKPFFMDIYPVTNEQFLSFLDASGYTPADPVNFLKHWENGMIPAGLENHPVVYVSLEDARAYTAWAGKRLPTEAEWQYAAQGKKNLLWPWGNEYDSTRCNHSTGKTTPVDAFPGGKSPFGAMDLTGNVWQLTGDVYDNGTYYFVIMKGGSHYHPTSSWWYVKGGPQPNTWHQQLLLVSPSFDRNATVGFRCVKDHDERISMSILIENPGIQADPELLALQSFLMTLISNDIDIYTFSDFQKKKNILKKTDILWFYKNDTIPADDRKIAGTFDVLRQYIENGGKMILANQAAIYLPQLGLEDNPPVTRLKPSKDQGYGRQLGYHAFREHPLFAGMHGGAYVLKPLSDTTVWQTGYFGDGVPVAGKVVAVDWDYIFLRESSRLIFEYEKGKGKVMAVGGYLLFSLLNRNRAHLELFTENLIRYMLYDEEIGYYWEYIEGGGVERRFEMVDGRRWMGDGRFDGEDDGMNMTPGKSSGNYWDLSGERMLVMGTDHGGITEIWAHPVLCLRDYRVDVKLKMQQDTMPDFRSIRPEIEVRPAGYLRKYDLAGNPYGPRLEERITVSPDKPVAVINYRYDGRDTAEFRVSFRLMFRLMWPYSEKVLGNTYYSWDEDLKAYIVTDQSGEFVTIAGVSAPRDITGTPSLSALITLTLNGPSTFNMIIASSSEGLEKTLEYYRQALAGPGAVFEASAAHAKAVLDNSLIIEGPVQDFNDGYRWALLATGRFHVATPGVGSSLVAGYATSDKGWDGEHAVSGRPGYGWYFGRDGAWSGFALLHYGDFKKVRSMLETFQRYQDMTGKIFHELSTSGIVHYD
ncbi:MAG: SUMF1/EgtB/PvdO family nonheme iron enzyme, partial [Bacteroidales bacterium]|nr:SUMF1/EgtB/PvdO family nonheme iron enzyme [Bacteroidales bacterium]